MSKVKRVGALSNSSFGDIVSDFYTFVEKDGDANLDNVGKPFLQFLVKVESSKCGLFHNRRKFR